MRPGQPFAPLAKPTAAAVRRMTGETPPEPQPLTPSDHPHVLLERLSRLVDEVRAAGITVEIAVTYSYSATL
jgi:hypothetical protein